MMVWGLLIFLSFFLAIPQILFAINSEDITTVDCGFFVSFLARM
jgi:hypothetical protein